MRIFRHGSWRSQAERSDAASWRVPLVSSPIRASQGAWGAADCVAAEMTGKLCAALRPKGALYLHGMMSGFVFTAGVPDILFRGVVIQGFWLETWLHSLAPQRMHEVCVRHASNVAGGSV